METTTIEQPFENEGLVPTPSGEDKVIFSIDGKARKFMKDSDGKVTRVTEDPRVIIDRSKEINKAKADELKKAELIRLGFKLA